MHSCNVLAKKIFLRYKFNHKYSENFMIAKIFRPMVQFMALQFARVLSNFGNPTYFKCALVLSPDQIFAIHVEDLDTFTRKLGHDVHCKLQSQTVSLQVCG